MNTFHIHINGLVQGVGFRPFVCRMAKEFDVKGFVSNANDGVHIEFNASLNIAEVFYKKIINHPPPNAIITHHHFEKINSKIFPDFSIRQSIKENKPDILLTPDIALCNTCRQELLSENNKRYRYPFTTCLHCGPRYSIITDLPYDRERTTMNYLQMCGSCFDEYDDIENRRHFSQTNSCKDCAVKLHFYCSSKKSLSNDTDEILSIVIDELKSGSIIAVKGIGGYLLLCDAANESSINTLRTRKQRPAKPFALLYADIEMANADVKLRSIEINALKEKSAPIVLCELKSSSQNDICTQAIAPGLDKIGLMLPCSPLLLLIANGFGKPLIATSGNISGSPILFRDEDALGNLFDVADHVLTYDRDIVAPQDDSVIQFTEREQKIILRRSRGLAPNYFPNPFHLNDCVLAMGAELKSAFALLDQKNLYISQYLGDQGIVESQNCFKETLHHVSSLIKVEPKHIIIDKHPGYFVSELGKEMAAQKNIPLTSVQHHKSHFAAVLAENNLLNIKEPVLGFVFDGTGYGDDGKIWGGEVFIYQHKEMQRVAHLNYFPQLLGDKMSKEPRLSALSLLKNFPNKHFIIQKYFSNTEWQYYHQLLQEPDSLQTSSMGRLLDGIAALLGVCLYNTYEGEAAMQLETLARTCSYKSYDYYSIPIIGDRLDWNIFLIELLEDWQNKEDNALIAWKVFFSLAKMVAQLSNHFYIDKIAFSGGVFQNALLNDLLIERLSFKRKLFFHQQLSPNDECIGFGQLAYFNILNQSTKKIIVTKDETVLQQFQLK